MSQPEFFGDPDHVTLAEAKAWLREQLDDGAPCPCCSQHAQVYRWSLYAGAARLLVKMYRLGGVTEFVETRQIKGKGQGDAARLRLWKLAEQEKTPRLDGGRSGWWRVTNQGEQFLLGYATIPKYAYVFDGRVLRYEDPRVTISDSLGEVFNYNENVRWNREPPEWL